MPKSKTKPKKRAFRLHVKKRSLISKKKFEKQIANLNKQQETRVEKLKNDLKGLIIHIGGMQPIYQTVLDAVKDLDMPSHDDEKKVLENLNWNVNQIDTLRRLFVFNEPLPW